MIKCPTCGARTEERLYFCTTCKHKIRDLRSIRFGRGTYTSLKMREFVETGDPAVFAKPGAPDYRG
jgi:hypothetical protein